MFCPEKNTITVSDSYMLLELTIPQDEVNPSVRELIQRWDYETHDEREGKRVMIPAIYAAKMPSIQQLAVVYRADKKVPKLLRVSSALGTYVVRLETFQIDAVMPSMPV